MPRISLFAIAIFLTIGAVLWGTFTGKAKAPAVSFQVLDGRRLSPADFAGRPLLVQFWSTSCSVCVKEIPAVIRLREEFKPIGLEVIAVAMAYDPPSRVLAFAKAHSIPYPIALDLKGEISAAFGGVEGTPTALLIDRQGRIVLKTAGRDSAPALRTALRSLN
jgi:peroxiredoxin